MVQETDTSAYLCWLLLVRSPEGATVWAQMEAMLQWICITAKKIVNEFWGLLLLYQAISKPVWSNDMFIILIVMIFSLVHTCIKIHQTVHFVFSLLYINKSVSLI